MSNVNRREGRGGDTAESAMTRRRFLFAGGATTVATAVIGFLGATARYLFPNVLYEPASRFPIGRPEDFPRDAPTFLADRSLYIFSTPAGFYAISAICSHLGCTAAFRGDGFACPCHGSRFDTNGEVRNGPAPRPLTWYGLALSPRGELLVDLQRTVRPDYRFKV